jgi:hypothetical protein
MVPHGLDDTGHLFGSDNGIAVGPDSPSTRIFSHIIQGHEESKTPVLELEISG